jgi:hypothetical protein
MRRYSEAVKADVRRRMSPPVRQSGIKFVTPIQRQSGEPFEICRKRTAVYERHSRSIYDDGRDHCVAGISRQR